MSIANGDALEPGPPAASRATVLAMLAALEQFLSPLTTVVEADEVSLRGEWSTSTEFFNEKQALDGGMALRWSAPAFLSVKGVLHQPDAKATLKPEAREAILLAVAKARSWLEHLASGRVRSFAEIAEREEKVERHIRLLTPLALMPPQTLAAIIAGTGPSDLTVTALAHTIPWAWPQLSGSSHYPA
jgi:hypothetical protein